MPHFFATRPSPAAIDRLVAIESRLRREHPAIDALRWTHAQKLHFTLRYLGDVDPSKITALIALATRAVEGTPPFALTMRGLDAFPSRERPNAIWIGATDGVHVLGALAASISRQLANDPAIELAIDPRPFAAHLTLARMSDRVEARDVAETIAAHHDLDGGTDLVDAIELMSSTRGGTVYETVARIPLASPRV